MNDKFYKLDESGSKTIYVNLLNIESVEVSKSIKSNSIIRMSSGNNYQISKNSALDLVSLISSLSSSSNKTLNE